MVYVDNFNRVYRQMIMCHMIADTTEELLAMVGKINVNKKWIQNAGKYNEHFDIGIAKKKLALIAGAKEITTRELVKILKQRPGHPDNVKNLQKRLTCINAQPNTVIKK